jgi:hypothetical protein
VVPQLPKAGLLSVEASPLNTPGTTQTSKGFVFFPDASLNEVLGLVFWYGKFSLADLPQLRHLASKLLSWKTLNPLKRWRFADLIPEGKPFGAGPPGAALESPNWDRSFTPSTCCKWG